MQRFKFFYKEPLVHNTIHIFSAFNPLRIFSKKIPNADKVFPAGQTTLIFSFFIFTSLSIKLSIQAAEKTFFTYIIKQDEQQKFTAIN